MSSTVEGSWSHLISAFGRPSCAIQLSIACMTYSSLEPFFLTIGLVKLPWTESAATNIFTLPSSVESPTSL